MLRSGMTSPRKTSIASNHATANRHRRFAAIDLDGTLLGPDLTISGDNLRAVARLQAAGFEVAIASGRHHQSIKPFALALPGVRWIVSAQGGEVSDVSRETVLSRTFLTRDRVDAVDELQKALGLSSILYGVNGIFANSRSSEDVEFYAALSGLRPIRRPLSEPELTTLFKVLSIGTRDNIDVIAGDGRLAKLGVQIVRTHQRLLEFMPGDVNKASGLATLTKHLGMTANEAVVFGDADNDIPMFEWAAESFAMAHAWPSARERARQIATDGPPESAFSRAVDMLLGAAF